MFMVDLAVPRDIEPEVAALSTSTSTPSTTCRPWCSRPARSARPRSQQAEAIIDAGVQSFAHWLDQRATVPLIQALRAQADDWRAAELARARKLLAKGERSKPCSRR
jgi:glutamyl-tRNA reductase